MDSDDLNQLASSLFEELKEIISKKKHEELATIIYDLFNDWDVNWDYQSELYTKVNGNPYEGSDEP